MRFARSLHPVIPFLACLAPSLTVAACNGSSGSTAADASRDGASHGDGAPRKDGATHADGASPPLPPSDLHPTFTFESGPVRPDALSPDGTHLFVANTSNASLDLFTVTSSGLSSAGSVYVGLEPVAVAARTNTEVWVVNQLSDSVSIVDTSVAPARVVRTLLVGDEPSDIVFGGPGGVRAFITTAHRGQQRTDPSLSGVPGAGDPQLTTAGIGRADVWVFDATNLGSTVGGIPISIVTLFGDTPRGLAVTPDGTTVYAAVFKSGNQSTATSSEIPCPGFDSATKSSPCTINGLAIPGAPPGPATNYAGVPAPAVALLLHADSSGAFRDVLGRDWSAVTEFSLPDQDVFSIDTSTLKTTGTYLHVGTTLFNMAVNPKSGHVYVSNTEARNDLRFEGAGTFAMTSGNPQEGHLAESRITVLDGTTVTPRYLNKHINYAQLPAPAGTASHSLATPLNIAVTGDGTTMFVSAFGSSKIGVFSTASLENDSFNPTTDSSLYITVSGGGPSGIVLDEARGQMYVSTRFDDGLSVVSLMTGKETSHITLHNPEPAAVTKGRPFLYDAQVSSSNGEAACASCHQFADHDHLAWDLGNPDADPVVTPIEIRLSQGAPDTINGTGKPAQLHSMKGPMTTQTMRGMVNHGPMHWRGDRAVGFFGTDTSSGPPYDSTLAFKNFIQAFNSLLGLGPMFSTTDMDTFSSFALDIVMPPNPVRSLDDSLNSAQAAGKSYFLGCDGLDSVTGVPVVCNDGVPTSAGHFSDGVGVVGDGFPCQGCHVLDPSSGFFGTNGMSSFERLPQTTKIPQLRNLYDKVGMFGAPQNQVSNAEDNGFTGPQVRGFGFEHDGSADTLFRFLQGVVFNANTSGTIGFAGGDPQRRNVEQFLLAFDSDLAPIVGQQVTLRSDNATAVGSRIDLMIARASTPFVSKVLGPSANECDLVARTTVKGVAEAFVLQSDQSFKPDTGGSSMSDSALRALATSNGQEVTYTCMPPGWLSGTTPRMSNPDAGTMDATIATKDGTTDAPSCAALGAASCNACCTSTFASGYAVLAQEALQCSCVPTLCGPLEAGVADGGDASTGDGGGAGPFGQGACAATCTSGTAPSSACSSCVKQTLGSQGSPGACTATAEQCAATSTACADFLGCVTSCP
jgi:DNA-binding beta-propeller fold protein YncE